MIYIPKVYGLCSGAKMSINVVKVHTIIKEKSKLGYYTIIVGIKDNAEVAISSSYASMCTIIESIKDVDNLKIENDKILVIAQTTINESLLKKILKRIRNKYNDREVLIINSVCYSQKKIQDSSLELALKVDYMIVVGEENSLDTKKLFNVCSNVCKTFCVYSKDMLFSILKNNKKIKNNSKIGITGCASTPISLIKEYIDIINFYFKYSIFKNKIENKMIKYNRSLINKSDNTLVVDAINKFLTLNSGGKYVRAFLINLGYLYKGKKNNYAYDLAVSYETFQTSILVHDDIIDNATTRRGKSTVPTLYNCEFKNLDCESNLKSHISDSLALCLADFGFYSSSNLLVSSYGHDKNFKKILSYYNDVVINTIKGEIIDVYLPFKSEYMNYSSSLDDILEISRLKTSWYTIVGPFCLGLILVGVNNKTVRQFEDALIPLGIAFQIKDDILGIYSDSETLGKNSSDISEFKQTVLYYYAMKTPYRDELLKYYGKDNLTSNDIERVRDIFTFSSSYDKSVSLMNSLFEETKVKISNISMKDDYRSIIYGFISYLEERKK